MLNAYDKSNSHVSIVNQGIDSKQAPNKMPKWNPIFTFLKKKLKGSYSNKFESWSSFSSISVEVLMVVVATEAVVVMTGGVMGFNFGGTFKSSANFIPVCEVSLSAIRADSLKSSVAG